MLVGMVIILLLFVHIPLLDSLSRLPGKECARWWAFRSGVTASNHDGTWIRCAGGGGLILYGVIVTHKATETVAIWSNKVLVGMFFMVMLLGITSFAFALKKDIQSRKQTLGERQPFADRAI